MLTSTNNLSKYVKMQSLFPECVLRQKMSVDGYSASEIDAFLLHGLPISASPSTKPPVSSSSMAKYVKMKTMLPEAAVRQKMTVDGCSADIIDKLFEKGPPSSSAGPASKIIAASGVANQRYARYVKMQKILPEGAVRQRMATDGVDASAIDAFFAADLGTGLCCLTTTAPASTTSLNKYEKMQKMFPEAVVRQKMTVDGYETDYIDQFLANAFSTVMNICTSQVDPRYFKYAKMATMFPAEVVRQKMTVDGFNGTEIAFFLAHGPPMIDTHKPSVTRPIPAKQHAKYVKMRRMLPEGAVRQKMCVDGCDAKAIDAFFTDTTTGKKHRDRGGSESSSGSSSGGSGGSSNGRKRARVGDGPYSDSEMRFRALGAGLF